MTREPAKNPAASIRARLLALAQAEGKTTSESWEDMRSNGSCIVWATQPTATDSQSREQRCLRSGRAIPTGPRRIWTSSDGDRRPFVKSRKQFGPRRPGRCADSNAGRYWIWRRRLSRAGIFFVSSVAPYGAAGHPCLSTRSRHCGKNLTKRITAIEFFYLERCWFEYDGCPRNARFSQSTSHV